MRHITVTELRTMLETIEMGGAGDLPVWMSSDPEGNAFHAFTHEDSDDGSGISVGGVNGVEGLVLWASYPRVWELG